MNYRTTKNLELENKKHKILVNVKDIISLFSYSAWKFEYKFERHKSNRSKFVTSDEKAG